jgi:hypothetical protein
MVGSREPGNSTNSAFFSQVDYFRIAVIRAAITVGKLAGPVTEDSLVKRRELATKAARPIATRLQLGTPGKENAYITRR